MRTIDILKVMWFMIIHSECKLVAIMMVVLVQSVRIHILEIDQIPRTRSVSNIHHILTVTIMAIEVVIERVICSEFVLIDRVDVWLHKQELQCKEDIVEREHRLPVHRQNGQSNHEGMRVDVGMEHRVRRSNLRWSERVVFSNGNVKGKSTVAVIALFRRDSTPEIVQASG